MSLPDSMPVDLARQLAAFRRRLRRIETITAGLATLAGLLVSFLFLAVLDRWLDTSEAIRWIVFGSGAAALAGGLWWWTQRWVWRPRDERALARLIQLKYPGLGDRLLGAVELSALSTDTGASPALVRAALDQVAREATSYSFPQAAPLRAFRSYVVLFAFLMLLVLAGVFYAPEALRRSAERWISPSAAIDRYTFTQLDDMPDTWMVAHGEPFQLITPISRTSRWIPQQGRARIDRQPIVRAAISNQSARFAFPAQIAPGQLIIRIGDVTRALSVVPVPRPELVALHAQIEWPSYTGRPNEQREIPRNRLALPAGSTVALSAHFSRPMNGVQARAAFENMAWSIDESQAHASAKPLEWWISSFSTAHKQRGQVTLHWSDHYALREARPYVFDLILEDDRAPEIVVEGLARSVAILPEETPVLEIKTRDDYGLSETGMEWQVLGTEDTAPGAPLVPRWRGVTMLSESPPGATSSTNHTYVVSPSRLGAVPGEWIMLQAFTRDHYPGRERVYAPPIHIRIISLEEHARLIEQALQALSARLEDAVREEELILAAHEGLALLDDPGLRSAQAGALLEQGAERERENARTVEQLAEDAGNLMREALRNPTVPAPLIQAWMDATENMRDAARNPMSAASQALSSAAAGPERREELSRAIQQEQNALAQLRAALEQTRQTMDQTQARNFINRLRQMAHTQRELGERVTGSMHETLGIHPQELQTTQEWTLKRITQELDQSRDDARDIRDDLGAFYLRTQRERYDDIRREMAQPDVLDTFTTLHQTVAQNHLFMARSNLTPLADQFDAWADLLEKEEPQCAGNGGSGGDDGLEVEVLIGLMRVRVWEEMLREQTRALNREKENDGYEEEIRKAAVRQRAIGHELHRLSELTSHPQAAGMIQHLTAISDEVAYMMHQRETHSGVMAGQTEIIETIAEAMQSRSSRSSTASSGVGSSSGSGSGEGGTGTSVAETPDPAPSGPGATGQDSRTGDRGRGQPDTWPAEYRDAIQRYYEAVEQKP